MSRTVKGEYPQSEFLNFQVIDTIPVPHPYCITPEHVTFAADHFFGRLGKEAIESAEKRGKARCGICKGKLKYSEHETALLVRCEKDPKKDDEARDELQKWLVSIKDEATRNGYAGFAFVLAK